MPSNYCGGIFDWDVACSRLDELNALTSDPNLWNDSIKAQGLLKEKNRLEAKLTQVSSLEINLKDACELIELAEIESDKSMIDETIETLNGLHGLAKRLQLQSLLSGEADDNSAYLEVNAGAGGTEACDWASMLLRMYIRWSEAHGYKVTYLDETEGDGAGIKSTTIKVDGPQAYGWLKHESGVHRLVRISPFDSNARRHTSFASVSVSPVVDDTIEIEVLDKDLKVDTFRASGAGGQHVNRTDSAVRITHLPTGIVVACQLQRSQHQNRAAAMEMLRARMYEQELKKREALSDSKYDSKTDNSWGHQIRSYVLQPYQMIKDLRTGVERTDSQVVLDGDLDDFMHASLAQRLGGTTGNVQDIE